MRRIGGLLLCLCLGCAPAPEVVDEPALHNVRLVRPNLYSGSSPENEVGFAELERLGVRTIISVDGATPDVAAAKAHGMRYIHLPIGYHGVTREEALRIARAVQDQAGVVYLHCHHGKHRGPAAAALVCRLTDPNASAEWGKAFLTTSGTDARYRGLWQAVRDTQPATAGELSSADATFPEIAVTPALTTAMVRIDHNWDELQKQFRDDIALSLQEEYRELLRLPTIQQRPADFQRWLRESEQAAGELVEAKTPLPSAMERLRKGCVQCHQAYRDNRP